MREANCGCASILPVRVWFTSIRAVVSSRRFARASAQEGIKVRKFERAGSIHDRESWRYFLIAIFRPPRLTPSRMNEHYLRWWTPHLSRDFEMLVFGNGCGVPLVLFPTSFGRYYQNKDFHLT